MFLFFPLRGYVYLGRASIFNSAAMGQARFLIYPWLIFIFNRVAMGRARFLLYPWFINRAAIDRARLLMYPWFIFFNRAAMGRARFLIYPWFIYLFIYFCCHVGQLNQTSLGQNSNDATCVVY